MPTYEEKISARISTRVKKKLTDSGQEAEIVRVALEEFFEKHKNDGAIIDAVIRHRSKPKRG